MVGTPARTGPNSAPGLETWWETPWGSCALTAPGPTAGAVLGRGSVGTDQVVLSGLPPQKRRVLEDDCWAAWEG